MFSQSLPISSEGGHTSFQNNVPDPVTSGKELPTFKFELEKSAGRSRAAATAKRPRSNSCRSRRESPASPCAWSRA